MSNVQQISQVGSRTSAVLIQALTIADEGFLQKMNAESHSEWAQSRRTELWIKMYLPLTVHLQIRHIISTKQGGVS